MRGEMQSVTKPRSSRSIGQWHTARADRNWLEKAQQPGPKDGEQSSQLKLTFHLGHLAGPISF
jgi:hypothetical protein